MQDHEKGTLDLLKLSLCANVGNSAIFLLIEKFGSAEAVLKAGSRELARVEGLHPAAAAGLERGAPEGTIEQELELMEKAKVRLVPYFSEDYPPPLRLLDRDAPVLLRMKGEYLRKDQLAVAVVGSRRCTWYGRNQAALIAGRLARMGFTIVSGLARGIDSAAHGGALQSNGRTIAVIGCGFSHLSGTEAVELAQGIAASGAVLSELPMATPPHANNFPPRNRLISALSLGVVVVEAAQRSGSLITARWAAEQGKQVFAVPGNVDSPASRGCHALIKDGAALAENAEDIVELLGPLSEPLELASPERAGEQALTVNDARAMALNEHERRVFESVGPSPKQIDAIIAESGLSASMVSGTLLALEVKGLVKQLAGQRYVRG